MLCPQGISQGIFENFLFPTLFLPKAVVRLGTEKMRSNSFVRKMRYYGKESWAEMHGSNDGCRNCLCC